MHVQGIAALLDLQLRHVAPAHRLEPALRDDHFAHSTSVGQQAVEIGRKEAVNAALPVAAGYGAQKFVQPAFGLRIPAAHGHAAAQAHELFDCRVQNRQRLAHGLIQPVLRPAQRHISAQASEGVAVPAAQLRCRRRLCLFRFQTMVPPFRFDVEAAGIFLKGFRYDKRSLLRLSRFYAVLPSCRTPYRPRRDRAAHRL